MKSLTLIFTTIGLAFISTSCGTGYYYQPTPPKYPGHPGIGVHPPPINNHPGCDVQPPVHGDCGL